MEQMLNSGIPHVARLTVVPSTAKSRAPSRKDFQTPWKKPSSGTSRTCITSATAKAKGVGGGSSTQAIVIGSEDEDDGGRGSPALLGGVTLGSLSSSRARHSSMRAKTEAPARGRAKGPPRKRRRIIDPDSDSDTIPLVNAPLDTSPARHDVDTHYGSDDPIDSWPRSRHSEAGPSKGGKGRKGGMHDKTHKKEGKRTRRESSPLISPPPTPELPREKTLSSPLLSPPPSPSRMSRRYTPLVSPLSSPGIMPIHGPGEQEKEPSHPSPNIHRAFKGVIGQKDLEVVQVLDSDDEEETCVSEGGDSSEDIETLSDSVSEVAIERHDDEDHVYRGQVCYFCSDHLPNPLPPDMFDEMLRLATQGVPEGPDRYTIQVKARRDFCIKHRRAGRYAANDYPREVDWRDFLSRIEGADVRARVDRCCRVPERSAVYKRIHKECEAWGKAQWEEQYKRGAGLGRTHAGYYGPIGRTVIQHHLHNLLQWELLPCMGRSVLPCAPFTSDEFIAHVLVPEIALVLIQQDANQDRADARRTWIASRDYGQHTFPADGDEMEEIERWMVENRARMRKEAVLRRVEEKRAGQGRSALQERGNRASRLPLTPSQEMPSQDSVLGSQEDWLAQMSGSQLAGLA